MTDQTKSSLRAPLARARGLGTARDGVHHWWMQRASAVALLPLSLFLLTQIKHIVSGNHAIVASWLHEPMAAVTMILFVAASFYHAALGIQVILEDYIHSEGVKILLLLFNKLFFILLGVTSIYAILMINFGAFGVYG